ncbi:MAG: carbohydrate kinase family protein [Candidatus Falkowbacteria bacterium]|nr:MAG: carbohydrate kinase family protein [Candidatus Falkowbacteria bacterium]
MPKDKLPHIAVSGSIAFDKIMDFLGVFSDNLHDKNSQQVHKFNLSLVVDNLKTSFGGTAGNIAYNLSLLKVKPIILGVVGFDFSAYRNWFLKNKINIDFVKELKDSPTSTAHIITDKQDNQISAFYPCRPAVGYAQKAVAVVTKKYKITLAIIAPDDKGRMLEYAAAYQKRHIPYIFDPGQMTPTFSAGEIRQAIKGARVLVGNDYEIAQIAKLLKLKISDLSAQVEILIITKGAQGSEVYQCGHKIAVKAAKPANTSDPTGAGDAYRAGLIKGLLLGYNLNTCGQLAATTAVYTVEKYGTQTHKFTKSDFIKRYNKNFKDKIIL